MEIHVQSVGIDGAHGPLLEPTSLRVRTGELALVAGEPGTGHTAFALALGGRFKPSVGQVLLDGKADDDGLRRLVAIVDAPDVSAPEEALTLSAVIGEELAFAKQPAGHKAVADWLLAHDVELFSDGGGRAAAALKPVRGPENVARFVLGAMRKTVPAEVRTRLLVEVASQRPGIEVLVLVLPDRHGAGPHTWWNTAAKAAERGPAVVVEAERDGRCIVVSLDTEGRPMELVGVLAWEG